MVDNINSPNWGWAQLGYTIERYGRTGKRRRIVNQAGETVLDGASHEEEVAYLRAIGVITDDAILSYSES